MCGVLFFFMICWWIMFTYLDGMGHIIMFNSRQSRRDLYICGWAIVSGGAISSQLFLLFFSTMLPIWLGSEEIPPLRFVTNTTGWFEKRKKSFLEISIVLYLHMNGPWRFLHFFLCCLEFFFVHPHTHTLKTRGFLHSDVKYPSIEEEKRKWILLSKGFFTYQWVLHDHLSLILSRDYFKWRQSLDLHKDGKEIEWELFQTLFHNV